MKTRMFVIGCIVVSVVVPLAIHLLFKLSAPHQFLVAAWSPGELLDYVGNIIGAVATIGTVILTIRFTRDESSEEHRLEWMPYLIVGFQHADDLEVPSGTIACLVFEEQAEDGCESNTDGHPAAGVVTLENVGNGSAVDFEVELRGLDGAGKFKPTMLGARSRERIISHIPPHETGAVSVCIRFNPFLPNSQGCDGTMSPASMEAMLENKAFDLFMDIRYKDILNNEYLQTMKMRIKAYQVKHGDAEMFYKHALYPVEADKAVLQS